MKSLPSKQEAPSPKFNINKKERKEEGGKEGEREEITKPICPISN
jgi:hypothetical protein